MKTYILRVWWIFCLLASAGCAVDEVRQDAAGGLYVQFNVSASDKGVKSGITVEEDKISNVNIFAYCDGMLENGVYSDDLSQEIGMELSMDKTYNVYSLANVGRMTAPVSEEDMKGLRCNIGSIDDFGTGGLPFAASVLLQPEDLTGSVTISLVRLVSKVNFTVDKDELGGLSVTSVRIMQGALDVLPFSGASAATAVAGGDYASRDDIDSINSGGSASFYVLENCQGVLLADNDDPWQKVPDNIPDKAGLCTYIEVGADFDGSYGISGSVVYRFFLGQDNTGDFNVCRNTESTVTLKVTSDGLEETSWRIDNSDISYESVSFILNAAGYVGQWGTVVFPDATEDHPVTITRGSQSITIPSSSSQYIGDLGDDAPNLAVYVPSSSTNTLYVCSGSKSVVYSLSQDSASGTLNVTTSDRITWKLENDGTGYMVGTDGMKMCDDGAGTRMNLYLCDYDSGEIVHTSDFAMPDAVRTYLKTQTNRDLSHSRSHIYWYFDTEIYDPAGMTGFTFDNYKYALEDEDYLYIFDYYACKKADSITAGTLVCRQNYAGYDSKYAYTVYPSFPDQRHIDTVAYNYILALDDDLYSTTSTIPFYTSYQGTRSATWYVARGGEYSEGDNERDIDALTDEDYKAALISGSVSEMNYVLRYSAPEDSGDYPHLAGGTYHIRGVVMNPYSHEEIVGDYSVDVILYMVVGAEVNFYDGEEAGYSDGRTVMDIAYLPVIDRCGVTDEEEFRDIWSLTCQWCHVLPQNKTIHTILGYPVYSDLSVPATTIAYHYSGTYDSLFSKISTFANTELKSAGSDFKFYNRLTGATATSMTTYENVYLELHRLQDVTKYYLIEDYYGSFDNY